MKIFRNFHDDDLAQFREELVAMGPVQLADVEESQHNIINTLRNLLENGVIMDERYM